MMIKYASESLVDFDSDVWSMACLLVPSEPQHSEFTIATATIQEGKHREE